MLKLFWGREEERREGRRGREGGNASVIFFLFIIFGLIIMATVYEGKGLRPKMLNAAFST